MQHVVFNQKGGVGKSTITCNLAAISAWQGLRSLVIDLDAQGNSTRYLLGADAPDELPNVAEFFDQSLKFTIRDRPPGDFIVNTPWEGLDLMASNPLLDELHGKLESRYKIYKLRDALLQLADDYDQIYIDTPPALNFYTRSALMAAQGCLIPFDCDDFSRRALYTLLENVAEIKADHNDDLLFERNPMELFVTACYGIYDPLDGSLMYSNAGHHPPLLRRLAGVVESLPCTRDIALGIMPAMDYTNHAATLAPGDTLLLYTDGVTEAFSTDKVAYGDERLLSWLAGINPHAGAAGLVASLVKDVENFVNGAEASDDLTCLVLCRK